MALTRQQILDEMKKATPRRVRNVKTQGVSIIEPHGRDPKKPQFCSEEKVLLISQMPLSDGRSFYGSLKNLKFIDE